MMSESAASHGPLRRRLLVLGFLFSAAFIIIAGGAYPRYNRVVYGAAPLAAALMCFGATAYPFGRRLRVAIGCCLLAAVTAVVWMRPSLVGAVPWERPMERAHVLLTLPRDRFRAELFAELQPVEIQNCRMERFGGPNDGGYLLCGNLLDSVASGYSYGIGPADAWGCDVARRLQVPVHQYDCFDPSRPTCAGGVTVFHDECIGPQPETDEGGRIFDTLENQFARNGDATRHVVLKIDIEGAEWASLLQAPATVLERIDQIDVELHGVGLELHVATVRRLKEFFHVANVHFTNTACGPRLDPFPAWVYEVLFVNKRIASAAGPRPLGPHALDMPNLAISPDCQSPVSRWSFSDLTGWLSRVR